jgi:hypothetical protein
MITNHYLTPKLEQSLYFIFLLKFYIYLLVKSRRRRQFFLTPMLTLHSKNCSTISTNKVQSIFHWSHTIQSLSSIELIYHIDSIKLKKSSIPISISIKQSETSIELLSINTHLQFDSIRDFYYLNIYDYIRQITNQNLIIQTIINNQTCQTSHTYLILSSLKTNQINSHQATVCKLQKLQIKFEELGLANLIIRPKEYTFTYCDGSCENLIYPKQIEYSSIHGFIQTELRKTNSNIPQLNCQPSQYADDNFLLRQLDGSMEIYPIKNIIVKQCACL